jgi:hypothetical protein
VVFGIPHATTLLVALCASMLYVLFRVHPGGVPRTAGIRMF